MICTYKYVNVNFIFLCARIAQRYNYRMLDQLKMHDSLAIWLHHKILKKYHLLKAEKFEVKDKIRNKVRVRFRVGVWLAKC